MVTIKARNDEFIETPAKKLDVDKIEKIRGFYKINETLRENIIKILKEDKYTRNNATFLCLVYWAKMNQIKILIPQDKFGEMTPTESITRALRKIKEQAREGDPELSFLLKNLKIDDNIKKEAKQSKMMGSRMDVFDYIEKKKPIEDRELWG